MAEISLTCMSHFGGGPDMPMPHHAWLDDKTWPGGGTVKVLKLKIGADTIQVWPADPDHIEDLGKKLLKLAKELHYAAWLDSQRDEDVPEELR